MFILRPKSQSCGSCKRCCEGWLSGEAYGQKFYPGKACAFLGSSGCNIYPNRPYSPCQTFECKWKRSAAWPAWLRPEQSNVIFIERIHEEQEYIRGFSTSRPTKPEVFEWAKSWSEQTKITIVVPRECMGVQLPSNGQKYRISVYGTNQIIRDYYSTHYELVE